MIVNKQRWLEISLGLRIFGNFFHPGFWRPGFYRHGDFFRGMGYPPKKPSLINKQVLARIFLYRLLSSGRIKQESKMLTLAKSADDERVETAPEFFYIKST